MVGVPGKSKGCSTCRRRKKGCDQKRPICGQCSASGYVCGGYQRDLTFVLHPASKAVEKAIFLPSKPRPLLLPAAPSLERSAIVSQCQTLFFDVYLPYGRCECKDQHILRCGRPSNWTQVVQEFNADEKSLDLAFTALSISRVGRDREDPRLVKESTKFYGKALKNLQKALYDPFRMHSEQVLTACLLLGLYEAFEGAGGKSVGWVSHAQGAARIVELRGPERHTESPAHILFLGTRLPIIYSAILRRKKTFLSDEAWLTVPWRKECKTGLDRLIDITTHIPGLLEQLDDVRSMIPSANQRHALHSCLATCRNLQKALGGWTNVRKPNSLPIAVKHEPKLSGDTYPFAEELTFENHLFLNANLINWSAHLVIATTISEIELLLSSLGFQYANTLSSTTTSMQEAHEAAKKIAQSIPYCLWPDMGHLGIDYIQFPMCLAFQFFMTFNNPAICIWMAEKANEMHKNSASMSPHGERSPMPITPGRVDIAFFDATKYSCQPHRGQENATNVACSNSVPKVATSPDHTISNRRGGPGCSTSCSATVPDGTTRPNDPDFDADYDLDSDIEQKSDRSSTSGHNSIKLKALEDTGDFTFVSENPARYYVDRSERDTLERT